MEQMCRFATGHDGAGMNRPESVVDETVLTLTDSGRQKSMLEI
ncbi:hypothetical protein PATSB16_33930 [Pandoraea thiooxydans]|nr:hypothetical protein PATSB16_33930 [Pandoraea thiooxydans]